MNCDKIKENIHTIKQQLNPNCALIVVSKYRSIEAIECAYQAGERLFAENRVQALLERKEELPKDIAWHLIGSLQRNKVKYIADFIDTIHSVDSLALLEKIQQEALKSKRIIKCLFQVHIAQESTKFGFTTGDLSALLNQINAADYPNIKLIGIMAMASNTKDLNTIDSEFTMANDIFNTAKATLKLPYFVELSIGMTSDYLAAQKHQSTMVRIGSGIFE